MMKIDFTTVGVSKLIKDYLTQKETLRPHFHRFPTEKNYILQAHDKVQNYAHREILCNALKGQMFGLALSSKQKENLSKLGEDTTVTITTGHQLNLLTGPLYFIYKILHTIKICNNLNAKQTNFYFVPIYWMATEDHDFLEINHFNTYEKSYEYNAVAGGFVGNIPSKNTIETLNNFKNDLPDNQFGEELKNIIQKAFSENNDLANATRVLVNELFGKYGLLILDGNAKALKKLMVPYFEEELLHQPSQQNINKTNEALKEYKNQAYAREINLFYLQNNNRERIELIKGKYVLSDSKKSFTREELIETLQEFPEKFSPNVILRPLYQEVILPNVAYVGGGGEISYWLQLKNMFAHFQVVFPMLVVRNSMLILPNAMYHKAQKLNLLPNRIFEQRFIIKREKAKENSELFQDIKAMKEELAEKFNALENLAKETGDDFGKMVRAQKIKQLNGFRKMEKRLYLAEQKQQRVLMQKIDEVFDFIYPNQIWQERHINFSTFYKYYGDDMFDEIYEAMDVYKSSYHILTLDSILK